MKLWYYFPEQKSLGLLDTSIRDSDGDYRILQIIKKDGSVTEGNEHTYVNPSVPRKRATREQITLYHTYLICPPPKNG